MKYKYKYRTIHTKIINWVKINSLVSNIEIKKGFLSTS